MNATSPGPSVERAAPRTVSLRLLPFLFLLYVFNILDRANVGFARLQFLDDLELSTEVYGTGVGVFFLGYFLFEVPSNLMLRHMGARRWIARILMSWGIISAAMMFVRGPWSLYLLRFLLGLAEAGFFPGIILYLSYWFPARERARAVSLFMTGSAVTGIVGSPLSGAILHYASGVGGLKGWQWLFLMEGLPTVLLGVVALFYLTDRPEQASWLTPAQRDWLTTRMNQEERHRASSSPDAVPGHRAAARPAAVRRLFHGVDGRQQFRRVCPADCQKSFRGSERVAYRSVDGPTEPGGDRQHDRGRH